MVMVWKRTKGKKKARQSKQADVEVIPTKFKSYNFFYNEMQFRILVQFVATATINRP